MFMGWSSQIHPIIYVVNKDAKTSRYELKALGTLKNAVEGEFVA